MIRLWLDESTEAEAIPVASVVPPSFIRLGQSLQSIDRRLGYCGQSRFVFFYYEPRGGEVIWNDGRSYGFGFGGWQAFMDDIAPLAEQYQVNLGTNDTRAKHVLVVDRVQQQAYLAAREAAKAFVAQQDSQPHARAAASQSVTATLSLA